MNKEKWTKVIELVDEILAQPQKDQESSLNKMIEENADLALEIQNHYTAISSTNNFLEDSVTLNDHLLSKTTVEESNEVDQLIGTQIGSYEVVELVGRGGMSYVYKAKRNDGEYERTVALKVIALGFHIDEVKKRFQREKRILARLSHRGIGQLIDAGILNDGRPYLLMEFMDGMNVVDHAHSNNLSLENRLQLFQEICEAVDFAHRNLVIHRDLKPDNIMVSESGDLKILDFGISTLIDDSLLNDFDSTAEHLSLYSLNYAAPEQIKRENISVATDVYALGLLLYELISNSRPFSSEGKNRTEVERSILNDQPSSLKLESGNSRSRELNLIIQKSLKKDVDERYHSVSELQNDVNLLLSNKPILASKSDYGYVVKKFVQRNASAVAVSLLSFIVITVLSVNYLININEQKRLAQQGEEKAQIAVDYLINLFENTESNSESKMQQSLGDFLQNSISNLETLDGKPELKEEASFTLAQVANKLGNYELAEDLYNQSYFMNEEVNEGPTERQASILLSVANIYQLEGRYRKSVPLFEKSLNIRNKLGGSRNDIASLYFGLATSYAHISNSDSLNYYLKAYESLSIPEDSMSTEVLINKYLTLADIVREQTDYESSVELLLKAKTLSESVEFFQEQMINIENSLGFTYRKLGESTLAIDAYSKGLIRSEQYYGLSHPRTLIILNNLSSVYDMSGNVDMAIETYEVILERTKQHYGEVHWRTASAYGALGLFQIKKKNIERAEELMNESVSQFETVLSKDHLWTVRQRIRLSAVYALKGDDTKADELFYNGIATLKSYDQGPLSYYDRSSMLTMAEFFTDLEITEYSEELLSYVTWHDEKFQ